MRRRTFRQGACQMAIRVYALVKELKIERSDLMELCRELKIFPKGASALASFSDEDAARIREYIKSGKFRSVENGGQDIYQA